MRKSSGKSNILPKSEWATTIYELRQRLNLSQDAFGHRLRSSAMCISRWERGMHEPTAGGYIELGNLAGAPLCLVFLGSSRSAAEDLRRVMPKFGRQLGRNPHPQLSNRERGERSEEFKDSAAGSDLLTEGCGSVTWRKGG